MGVAVTEIMQEEDLLRAEDRSLHRTEPPTGVPGYKPERLLGKGAFGEVWLAQNCNTGCRVAIKFYAHGADWALLAREVDKLRYLATDRYVVQLEHVGWEAKPPYYVMEYIESGSLEQRLACGPLPVSEAVDLFREIVVGLSHAHAKGILHCDLKPANILMGADGKPRLADFGQSRLSHEQSPALGTLFYMAPEQASLKAAPDASWDVYALGVILYRMLTGQLPYHARERLSEIQQSGTLEARLERYSKLILESPLPDAHRRVPGVDRKLVDIIDRCLAKKPGRRFASVEAVLAALNERALRKARRPLLMLGVVGPAVSLAVIVTFAILGFRMAVDQSSKALLTQAEKDDRFYAHNVATLIALQIDRNWGILEKEAQNPKLAELLQAIGDDFDRDFQTAPEKPEKDAQSAAALKRWHDAPKHKQLQAWLADTVKAHQGVPHERAWWLLSPQGRDLADVDRLDSTNNEKYLGWDCAFRDYYHGLGEDVQPGRHDLRPISDVYLSRVYRSRSQGFWEVAFSAPVHSQAPEGRRVLGVLVMAVKLEDFQIATGDQLVVIFDSKPNVEGWGEDQRQLLPAAIIFHPHLKGREDLSGTKNLPPQMDQEVAQRVRARSGVKALELQATDSAPVSSASDQGMGIVGYHDPIDTEVGEWVATVDAVVVGRGPQKCYQIGWGVLVEEPMANVTGPVEQSRAELRNIGILALALLGTVLVLAWGFVLLLFNDSSRSRLSGWLWRRAGLLSGGLSSRTGSLGSQPRLEGVGVKSAPIAIGQERNPTPLAGPHRDLARSSSDARPGKQVP